MRDRSVALAPAGPAAHSARMGRFRLLALDIDGTVTDSNDTVRPRVRDAIRAVAAQGVRVVLVTGRSPFTTRWVADELGVPVGAVMGNGAVTADDFDQPSIERRLVPLSVAAETIGAWRERQLIPLVFDDPVRSGHVATDARARLPAAFLKRNQRRIREVPDLLAWLDREPLVVNTMGDEATIRAEAHRLAEQLAGRGSVQPVYHPLYATWTLDVGAHGVDKWSSLMSLAARAGIPPDAILAIGDGLNDIPMLRGAGWSIAMGNAAPETQAAADEVAPACDDDGLVWALERHFPRIVGG